jgi:molecular chaperone DnaJ
MTLAEVATGVKRTIKLKTLDACEHCGGTGAKKGTSAAACGTCGGNGEVRRAARSMFGQFVSVSPSPTCGGEGTVIRTPCEVCRGEGRVRAERTVQAEIPAGVSTNNYLTMRGQGAAGPRNGGKGDLLLLIEVEEDDRFERQGEHLATDLPLSFSQAALGGPFPVPTPWGEEEVIMPSGTQTATVLRLGRGSAPRAGRARRPPHPGSTCGRPSGSIRSRNGSSASLPTTKGSHRGRGRASGHGSARRWADGVVGRGRHAVGARHHR